MVLNTKTFLFVAFITALILSLLSNTNPATPSTMQNQDKLLQSELEYVKSDEEFDYYTINLSNNSNATAGILYDPAAFNPEAKKYNRLFCGSSNKEKKRYMAVLYHMDHLEISEILKVSPNTCTKLYVKWEKKYTDWKKSLDLLYYWANEEDQFSINDIDAKYLSIDFNLSLDKKSE